jgi:hypothetical protein
MPILDDALAELPNDEIRQVMNAATGLEIKSSESISLSVALFIEDMVKADMRGVLLLDVLPAAMREVTRLRKLKQSHFGG